MEKSINQVFKNRVDKYGDKIAIEKKINGNWQSSTWNEYYEKSRAVGLGLYSLGVRKGDKVSLLSENRLEWLYVDMGSLGIGACVVPVYTTLPAEEVEHIVSNSESKILVVENNVQLKKALEVTKNYSGLFKIVLIEEDDKFSNDPQIISYNKLIKLGYELHNKDQQLFEKLSGSIEQDDLATIVYTSGTTGIPKGAMISHRNIISVINSLHNIEPHYGSETDQSVPFLPLSHVFERIAGHFYGMHVGITSSYAESINTLLDDFADKKPTIILAVPRVCEKVYQKIIAQVEEQSSFKKKIFFWGQKIGSEISKYREAKKTIPFILKLKYKIAYKLIFQKLMNKLGGRVRWMTASGAPTAKEIIRFFNAAGIMVIQGYGMTECTAPATMQNLGHYKIGTAGNPLPGMDIKIAQDGEILLKGGNIFCGYWKMEKETIESFTEDGYFKSGDIGMFDENGFLFITDRKKDIIITSGGKNIAPQKIENIFKDDPLFTQFIVVGEKKKYISALCNVNPDLAKKIAIEKKISYEDLTDLLLNEKFLSVVQEHVDKNNLQLARYETIKKFTIIENEFSQETGELTPSLKVKRKVVRKKYRDIIDQMYDKTVSDKFVGN